jgi:hypothetical protein
LHPAIERVLSSSVVISYLLTYVAYTGIFVELFFT